MNIGIPKERRPFEFRVGLSPDGVEILTQQGHTIYVEHEAGVGAGFSDRDYERAGARLAYSVEETFGRADLLLKIARPLAEELNWLSPNSVLVCLLHLASAQRERVELLLEKKIAAIAYERIQLADGSLPVLRPFSQIGGLIAAQTAARLLQSNEGGKGILIGGIPGVPPAEVLILGGGVVGTHALQAFLGLGAHVTVLDKNIAALQRISDRFPGVITMNSSHRNIEQAAVNADVIVGAVLIPGQRAPILVARETVRKMKPRSVIIDVSIDEGGCFETSRPTSHDKPFYIEEGILHSCVPNIPSVVAHTATRAFVNAAMPYIVEIAAKGAARAIQDNPAIARAVSTYDGALRQEIRMTAGEE